PLLHGTWPGHHHHIAAANANAPHLHHRAFGSHLPAHEFEWVGDGNNLLHSGGSSEGLQLIPVMVALAHCADDGALGAADQVWLISALLDSVDDGLDLLLSSVRSHVDDHGLAPLRVRLVSLTNARAAWISRTWLAVKPPFRRAITEGKTKKPRPRLRFAAGFETLRAV